MDQKKLLLGKRICNGMMSFLYRLERLFIRPQFCRLTGSLDTFRHEVDTRGCLDKDEHLYVFKKIEKLLEAADQMLQKNRLDEGWKYLHAARRTLIYTYSTKDLQWVAVPIRSEAEKLSVWRKNAVEELIGSLKAPVKECTHEQVSQAALILDEHFNNQYYRMHLWQRQLQIMSLLLFLELGAAIWLIKSGGIPLAGVDGFPDPVKALPGVLLFGLLGGTLSGLFPIDSKGKNAKIPELLANFLVMLLQVVIGAGSGFAVFFLIKAGLLNDKLVNVLVNPYVLYAISFIAGFNKRLVLKAVKGVVGEEK